MKTYNQNGDRIRHDLASTLRDRLRRRAGACVASLAITLTGCMLGPNDGQTLASTSSVIPFGGYTANPNERVQVEAFDVLSTWTPIANTTTAATSITYDGTALYNWSVNAAVPASGWRRGTTGFVARVRARVGVSLESTAFTFTPDMWSCLNDHPGIYDFIESCQSPRSPNAFLYTSDYPAGIDLMITDIRRDAGRLDVSVHNGGRPGRITTVECDGNGVHVIRTVDAPINPVETQVIQDLPIGFNAGQTALCRVFGVNEDGAAEANTANNTRTQVVF